MSRRLSNGPTAPEEPLVTQAEPTKPRPRDANGYELDDDGLPMCGPARAAMLAEREAMAAEATATDTITDDGN